MVKFVKPELDEVFKMKNITKSVSIVLTAIYSFMVIWIILFKMSTLSEITYLDHIRNINLIPFHYDVERSYHLSEVLKNVMFFIPLGVYFKMLRFTNAKAILFGMTFSLSLEILQFILAVGATDITDIITNTTGTAIGVGIYSLLALVFRKREKLDKLLCILASICTILFISFMAILLLAN